MAVGLYIHVPFCLSRCHFCSFSLEVHRPDRAQAYLEALRREIELRAEAKTLDGRTPDSLYFGGGTPSLLPAEQLAGLVALVRTELGLTDRAEITLEAHPGTVTERGLAALVGSGFNRISFGIQSLDQDELLRIGRPNQTAAVRSAVQTARSAGFANLNLDLIYGLPGQTIETWLTTLDEALALQPTHLSCYALTVEERTRLATDIRRGDRHEPDQTLQNELEDLAAARLVRAGFTRYEISNYCLPGYASRHNLHYWAGDDYLGLGPSAQSYLNGTRFGNVERLDRYLAMLRENRLPAEGTEHLSRAQRQREALVFGLRLTDGVALERLPDELKNNGQETVRRLTDEGLLEEREGRLRLTDLGRRFADSVAVELL
ncbi:MAG: radical SAM family heme chaperone HemW [Nitrospirota bacterium]